jgi:hypothetical protein
MAIYFPADGYPLDSPRPYRLWFTLILAELGVDDPVASDRRNRHSLLHQTKEYLASTLGSPYD